MTRRAGFTLIEIMVALGVMVVIASLGWSTIAGTIQVRDYLAQDDQLNRSARVALDRISREVSLAFLTENTTAVNTYRTVFVGRDEDDADMMWFATKAHRRAYRGAHECDQAEVTLFTESDPDNPQRLILYHRESQWIDQEPDKDGAILPLATNVTRFDLLYLDPTIPEWRDDWDTTGTETPNRLPRAVQVVLTLMGPDPDDPDKDIERPYVRTILIEVAKPMKKSLLSGGEDGIGSGKLSQAGTAGMKK